MAQVGPQQPPAAYAADAAAAPPAIPHLVPRTYSAKFASLGDAYEGAYLPLLESHHPNAQLTPAVVLQTALTLSAHEGLPGVYAYQVPGSGEIRTVHRLGYASSLPGVAAPWDGILFAFDGDVVPPGLVNLVQVPANAFHLTTAVAAPTAATLNDHWAGVAADHACVGPFELGDGDVTPVITRRFMPVPIAYVHLMHNRVLTPRQAWQIAEQIIADGRAADCAIFLDFLRAACTFCAPAAVGDPFVAAAALTAALVVPLADEALRRQIWNGICRTPVHGHDRGVKRWRCPEQVPRLHEPKPGRPSRLRGPTPHSHPSYTDYAPSRTTRTSRRFGNSTPPPEARRISLCLASNS